MGMTSTITLRYEGPPSCADCQRNGVPLCGHIGFNAEAWDYMVGQGVHVPGLDDAYSHTLRHVDISADRKTVTLTVDTERPQFHDLARHLSQRPDVRTKAAVRAVHHETRETLEEGHYDRFLQEGTAVAIDRDLYHVAKVEHPFRNVHGTVDGDVDLQIAHLVPVPVDTVRPAV